MRIMGPTAVKMEHVMELSVRSSGTSTGTEHFSDRHSPRAQAWPVLASGPIKCGSPGLRGASSRAGPGHWPNLPLKARPSQVRHEVRVAGPYYRLDRLLLEKYQCTRLLFW